jgi:hypothetical protein
MPTEFVNIKNEDKLTSINKSFFSFIDLFKLLKALFVILEQAKE